MSIDLCMCVEDVYWQVQECGWWVVMVFFVVLMDVDSCDYLQIVQVLCILLCSVLLVDFVIMVVCQVILCRSVGLECWLLLLLFVVLVVIFFVVVVVYVWIWWQVIEYVLMCDGGYWLLVCVLCVLVIWVIWFLLWYVLYYVGVIFWVFGCVCFCQCVVFWYVLELLGFISRRIVVQCLFRFGRFMIFFVMVIVLCVLYYDVCQYLFDLGSVFVLLEVLYLFVGFVVCIELVFVLVVWLIFDDGQLVGLCLVMCIFIDGDLNIGYGIVLDCQGCGIIIWVIGELVCWCVCDGCL